MAYRYAKVFSKPYIVTLHGTLSPWCLNHKAIKKRIYAFLIQKRMLREAGGIQSFSESEAVQLGDYNINNSATIIPNGLDVESFADLKLYDFFDDIYPELNNKKVILFLGRLHPVKGLDLLCKSFGEVVKSRNDVRLIIAGPDTEGYKKDLESILKSVNAYDKVIFPGMLKEANKYAALNRANVFVLSSYSEGQSIAILEAMISELPVIITEQCYLNEVAETESGIIIEPEVDQLTQALLKLLDNASLCKKMGKNGKKLVTNYYSWDRISGKMIEFYKNVIRSYK
jgi:glycosyltransferase involved in cell wall biosynthesis